MYAGERIPGMPGQEQSESSRRANGDGLSGQGDAANQAVEVIEMANGETIWCVNE